ncbi:hypothetical protein BHM03_00010793 [Ensete ventricosum]|nr:hypothetical protein BHM03_00010793 [Ensete ventricosum]
MDSLHFSPVVHVGFLRHIKRPGIVLGINLPIGTRVTIAATSPAHEFFWLLTLSIQVKVHIRQLLIESRSVYLLTIEDDCLAVREDADSVTRQIILHTSKFHSPIFSSIGDFLSPQCERPRMVRPCKSVSAVPSIACIDLHMTKCSISIILDLSIYTNTYHEGLIVRAEGGDVGRHP